MTADTSSQYKGEGGREILLALLADKPLLPPSRPAKLGKRVFPY